MKPSRPRSLVSSMKARRIAFRDREMRLSEAGACPAAHEDAFEGEGFFDEGVSAMSKT